MLDNNDIHFKKYLKYKSKYLELKQSGAGFFDSYTEATEKSIIKRNSKEIILQDYEKYRQYNNNIIKNLISNFKKDNKLDNDKLDNDKLDKLDKIESFITTYKKFTKISPVVNEEQVNFTTNFEEIDRLMNDKKNYNNTFIEKLEIFKNELYKYIIANANLFGLKYQVELNSILRQYISFLITFIKMHIPLQKT